MSVFNTPLQPGTCDSSKYRCNFPTGYVRSFKKLSRFRPHRGRWVGVCDTLLRLGTCEGSKNGSVYATVGGVWWGVCDTPLRPGTCGPSKNCPVFVPFGVAGWGVFDTPLRPDTCEGSKNCPVFVPFGAACGAYSIRPYDRIRAILRNTDTIYRPEGGGRLGGGAVGATACGGGGRE